MIIRSSQLDALRLRPRPPEFVALAVKMEQHELPPFVIDLFQHYWEELRSGERGMLPEKDIRPVGEDELPDLETLGGEDAAAGREALPRTVVIRLNGGLGTSMGLERAKSLIAVKDGLTFLEILLRQARRLRERHGAPVPLLLMNSFRTHADTLAAAGGFVNQGGLPLAFLQHKFPKVLAEGLAPASWPAEPELEWNPPGHGDLYAALATSGLLRKLIDQGFQHAFVANSDNLGAVLDTRLLGYMARTGAPFLMEVCRRTPADRKGGHLARLADGRLELREVAQCPEEDLDAFQDIARHRFFNTNNLWLDLCSLAGVMDREGMMPLGLIVNPKTLDPRDESSPKVFQLERAMGSAVSVFEGAGAVVVPRRRFAPVKTTADLLAVRSDLTVLTGDEVLPNPARTLPGIEIELDKRFFKKIEDFEARFPDGPPSLVDCAGLSVTGDVLFPGGLALRGRVRIGHPGPGQLVLTQEMLDRPGGAVEVLPA